jgi:hypothetical protein
MTMATTRPFVQPPADKSAEPAVSLFNIWYLKSIQPDRPWSNFMDLTRCPKLVNLTIIVLFSLCLAACGTSQLTQENFDKIHTGMTQAEVTAILGEPTE